MPVVIFENANVLDVERGSLLGDQTVAVQGDRIAQLGDLSESMRNSARVIDCRGMTLMPGLIDGHVHATAATADLTTLAEWSPFYVGAAAARRLGRMLSRGFTTVRDTGGADFGLADAVDEGLIRGPRIFFGGKAISQTGGHGDMRSRGRQTMEDHACCPNIAVVCDGVAEMRRTAREQLRTGAHHIKLMLSGGVASPTDRIDATQFAVEEIRAAVEEAQAVGAYVAGHAYTAPAIDRALEAGVRTIEHGNLLEDSSLRLFREHDAYYVPTLVTYYRLAADGQKFGLSAGSAAKVDHVLSNGLKALEDAHRAGVNIVLGTDLLGGMEEYQLDELRIRSEVQQPIDIIRSATVVAAEMLNQQGQLGRVEPGAIADLLLVDGDPVEDISVLLAPEQNLKVIMKSGTIYGDRTDD